jgi:hypothetical protein
LDVDAGSNSSQISFGPAGGRRGIISTSQNGIYDDGLVSFASNSSVGAFSFKNNNTTELVRIDSAGNVGIGTSSPAQKLHVNSGSLLVSNPSGSVADLELAGNGSTSGTNTFLLRQAGNSEALIYNRSNAAIVFGTNAAERARIDSSGNVGIGTSSPTTKLDVAGYIKSLSQSIIDGAVSSFRMLRFSSISVPRWDIGVDNVTESGGNTGSNLFISAFNDDGSYRATVLTINRANGGINANGNPITNCKSTAKAWVNFSGTGTTGQAQTIRSSYNVSSVTKNGTGDYTVNFATAMNDANYTVSGLKQDNASFLNGHIYLSTQTTTSVRVVTIEGSSGSAVDSVAVTLQIFGN